MKTTISRKKIVFFLFYVLPAIAAGQNASGIYFLDMSFSGDSIALSNPRLISNHKGYNNQPFFHNSLPLVYYSSFDDSGRSDIKYYDYVSRTTQNLTATPESEYSPATTPDNKFISCVIARKNGQQDLGKYPINGKGVPVLLIDNLKIGYYGWMSDSTLLLFVLQGTAFELHYYNLVTKQDSLLSIKPGRCFAKVPGEDAMSFVDKTNADKWVIKKIDNRTHKIETIAGTPALNEDFTWTKNGLLIMGNGKELFFCNPKSHAGEWHLISITGGANDMKKITRLAVNAGNNLLAVVADE